MTVEKSSGSESSEMVTVSEDPFCTETSLPSLDTWITPTDRLYTRNHFSGLPDLDSSGWRLEIGGAVDSPLTMDYKELLALPSREVVATLECAGNSRSHVEPPAEGSISTMAR